MYTKYFRRPLKTNFASVYLKLVLLSCYPSLAIYIFVQRQCCMEGAAAASVGMQVLIILGCLVDQDASSNYLGCWVDQKIC
jgi:hypothetical protein